MVQSVQSQLCETHMALAVRRASLHCRRQPPSCYPPFGSGGRASQSRRCRRGRGARRWRALCRLGQLATRLTGTRAHLARSMRSLHANELTVRSELGATTLAQKSLMRRASWIPEAEHLVKDGSRVVANGEDMKRSLCHCCSLICDRIALSSIVGFGLVDIEAAACRAVANAWSKRPS